MKKLNLVLVLGWNKNVDSFLFEKIYQTHIAHTCNSLVEVRQD